MQTRRTLAIIMGVVGIAATAGTASVTPATAASPNTQHTTPLSSEQLQANTAVYRMHETTLANPFMEGRAPGTRGNRIAAEYIEWNYRQLGLKPAFPNEDGDVFSSYRQVFTAPPSLRPGDSYKVTKQELSYTAGADTVTLKPGTDYNVIGHSGSGEVTGPLVFAGYSLDIEDRDYSSYPVHADLNGKVVMILRYEPMDDHGKSLWAEEDQRWSAAAAMNAKLREAAASKASAIILVSPPGADDPRANALEDMSYASGKPQKVPVLMMSRAAADALVRAADSKHRSLMALRKLADKAGGTEELGAAEVTVTAQIEKIELKTDNVGAVLPGKGALADEYIVIGSHYDHVGYGYFGSRNNSVGELHPGADDNASGTAGNLLMAKTLSDAYAKLPADAEARSVLFLCFSAEESGLVGSYYYTKHMIAPSEKHYLMLNMDMIGRLRDDAQHHGKIEVGGVGTGEGLASWLRPYWDDSGMNVKAESVGAPNSDHFAFYGMKIPNLFFFSGYHTEYHTPGDTVATINMEGGAKVADLVARIALDAAQRSEPLEFSDGLHAGGDKTAKPEKSDPHAGIDNPHAGGKKAAGPGDGPGRRVRLGIVPDMSGGEEGVAISGTSPGTPAEKAGFKAGDRLIKWNDEALADLQSLQDCMEQAKPGQAVSITFVRDGKEQVIKVKLALASEGAK